MKLTSASGGTANEGYLLMWSMIGISYFFLSLAVKKISIGVAYAIWEGLGIALITLMSVVVFKEHLNTQAIIGLGMAVIGIVMVNAGESHEGSS
ncbi:SMR family transporter [Dongshaea marina]|uniref:SMR family transporter n=1 Tax=Dongshaea marina TaxID=2047966 RepID=UPI002D7960C2|nr:SMR family transporter [Dongshaea marina]